MIVKRGDGIYIFIATAVMLIIALVAVGFVGLVAKAIQSPCPHVVQSAGAKP
jgi:hypothetical protein